MAPVTLNRRLVLEAPVPVPDGAGGSGTQWVAQGTLWARLEPRTGGETAGAAAALSRARYRIVVRAAPAGAPSRPVPGQRLRDGARIFAITAVTEHDARARYLACLAEEEVVL